LTDPRALQEAYDGLVVGFLLPLLEGREARVGRPIAPACASYFAQTRSGSSDADARIFDALHRGASEIATLETLRWPSADLLALSASMYDVLATTDPALDRAFARSARPTIVAWARGWLALVGLPSTRGEALARHVLVERFGALRRRDVVVRNWAYTYRFFGRPVPANVVAFPKLRFVRQDETILTLDDVLEHERDAQLGALGLRGLAREITARSPVTVLLRMAQTSGFRFSASTLAVLSDRAIRGAVAGHLLKDEWRVAAQLGDALFDPMLAAAPGLLAIALQLVLEMHLVCALDGHAHAPTTRELVEPGSVRYAACLVASFDDERALRELATFDDGDRVLLQRRAEAFRSRIPRDALAQVRALVSHALAAEPAFLPS
jgi:hypothetical protein